MKKINAKKIIDISVDIILFAIAFSITDYLMVNVMKSESLWLELGVYLVLYVFVFGSKNGIVYLWSRHKKRRDGKSRESET